MPRFTIDGKEVEVPSGGTVLDGARRLGIQIPTLCHVEGLEPRTSCFVCLVMVEGKDGLLPACGLRASDGMRVIASSDEVRNARRAAIELLLSDHAGYCEGPCTIGCPAGMDIPGVIRLIAAGRHAEAGVLARERIALPASLGCICPRFCERVCRRGEVDGPVVICALKRFAGRAGHGTAPREACETVPAVAQGVSGGGRSDLMTAGPERSGYWEGSAGIPGDRPPPGPSGRRVAIIGAGPAGLSAAYYLLRMGHACVLFDRNDMPGGMLRYAIPRFRLPLEDLYADIEAILRMGAGFRPGTHVGTDVTLEHLRREYAAILIATGAPAAGRIACEGGELAIPTLELLEAVGRGRNPDACSTVAVIGLDAAAFDAARTCVRLGASDILLLAPAGRERMRVPPETVAVAEAEGVRIMEEVEATRIEPIGGGRFAVLCTGPGGSMRIEADRVFAMSGRAPDSSWAAGSGLAVSSEGRITADRLTLATDIPGVFAAGEAAYGPGPAVRAVASGRLAAICIDQYLKSGAATGEPRRFNSRIGKMTDFERSAVLARASGVSRADTLNGTASGAGSPGDFRMGRLMTASEAAAEAARCLGCDCARKDTCRLRELATEYEADQRRFPGGRRSSAPDTSHPQVAYDPGKCIMCGICIGIAERAGEARGITFLGRGFSAKMGGPFFDGIGKAIGPSALQCAAACPTGALAVKQPRGAQYRGS
ncbi:MAG: FAD-dependent oxidoreductase [Planctomycetota bacterium]|nr:FAD-dependent oxidoreductase [Planctomycetota bacterium]